jgi:hypothetical protein
MRFYGAEYNNIELGIRLCSIKPHKNFIKILKFLKKNEIFNLKKKMKFSNLLNKIEL